MTMIRKRDRLANALRLARTRWRRPDALVGHWLYGAGFRSTASLTLPDFLVIGAQKAGTTWLHENLRCHPRILVPAGEKEVHFFDYPGSMTLRQYAAIFADGKGKIRGEVTPDYARLSRRRVAFIRRIMPRVRLVFVLRDPVERAWSHAIMDLVRRTGRVFESVPDEEFIAHFRSRAPRRNGAYADLIDTWSGCFPSEQLLVEFFENIAAQPRELLSRVFRHLGAGVDVDWSEFPYTKKIHRGAGIPLPVRFRSVLEPLYAEQIERIAVRFGGPAEAWRVRRPSG